MRASAIGQTFAKVESTRFIQPTRMRKLTSKYFTGCALLLSAPGQSKCQFCRYICHKFGSALPSEAT
jgi:hypothetical protein